MWLCRELESCIESALLKNRIPHDYLFYEDYTKVSLGESVTEFRVAEMTGLTPAAVQSLSKELGHTISFVLRPGESEADYLNRQLAEHIGEEAALSMLPEDCKPAQKYLDALREAEMLTADYRWAKKAGTTNYHAARAAQIIINNCPEVTYLMIGQLFGIPNVGSYTSLAKEKISVKRLIEQLFQSKGLSITVK